MGREANCTIRWQGTKAEGKVLLESTEVIVRGPVRARIPRSAISGIRAEGGVLHVQAGPDLLELALGEKTAASWLAALQKPPPALTDKLGIKPGVTVFLATPLSDPAVQALLAPFAGAEPQQAQLLLAELQVPEDIGTALRLALAHPHAPLWALHAKGKGPVTDGLVRSAFRTGGLIDSKSCAVSDRLTATRYGVRPGG